MVATARVAGAEQIDPSYSPADADVPPSNILWSTRVYSPDCTTIGSSVIAGFTDKHTTERRDMCSNSPRRALFKSRGS